MGTGGVRDRGYDDIVIGRWVLTAPCVKRPDLLSGLSFCTNARLDDMQNRFDLSHIRNTSGRFWLSSDFLFATCRQLQPIRTTLVGRLQLHPLEELF